MRNRILFPIAAIMLSCLLLGVTVIASAGDLDAITKAGKIRVGMEMMMKKRTYFEGDSKKPAGLEVDLFSDFAKKIGVEMEIVDLPWDGLIPALVSGRIDVLCTGMFRLEKRSLSIDFSEPMWTFGQDLMARKDDKRFKTWEDANKPGIKAAMTLGGAGEIAAKMMIPKAQHMTFPSGDQSGLALAAKQVDVWVDDDFYHAIYADDHATLATVAGAPSVIQTATGMGVRHGSDLLPVINLYLYNAKRAGLFDQLLKKWGLPPGMNAKWDPTAK